jgi:hypothetical protein
VRAYLNRLTGDLDMKRLTPFLLLAALALSGCGGSSATQPESAASGATNAQQPSQPPSPWANDPYFVAPPI